MFMRSDDSAKPLRKTDEKGKVLQADFGQWRARVLKAYRELSLERQQHYEALAKESMRQPNAEVDAADVQKESDRRAYVMNMKPGRNKLTVLPDSRLTSLSPSSVRSRFGRRKRVVQGSFCGVAWMSGESPRSGGKSVWKLRLLYYSRALSAASISAQLWMDSIQMSGWQRR